MGRRKNSEEINIAPKLSNTKELLVCPVCGKNFEPDDDTKYIASGGYTCSWKCFLTVVKRDESKRREKESEKVEIEKVAEIKPEDKTEKKTRKTRKNSKK